MRTIAPTSTTKRSTAADRFIELHPANPDVPYAYYLKGLCYYERISDIHRDQEMTEQAKKVFEEMSPAFPTASTRATPD